jgi:hypothetical protein
MIFLSLSIFSRPASMRLRLDEMLEHPWVTNLPQLLPVYKTFMRNVQCVRWYEAEVLKLRNIAQSNMDNGDNRNSNVGQKAIQKMKEYESIIDQERQKQPGLLQAYLNAKNQVISNGGSGSSGCSGSWERK